MPTQQEIDAHNEEVLEAWMEGQLEEANAEVSQRNEELLEQIRL